MNHADQQARDAGPNEPVVDDRKPVGHTPGPWWSDGSAVFIGNGDAVWREGHPGVLFTVDDLGGKDPRSAEQIEADARLIAAAPDLLAACEAIVAEDDRLLASGDCLTDICDHIDRARAAIAKAKGGAA